MGLELPPLLSRLLEEGRWPHKHEIARARDGLPIRREQVQRFAPEEDEVYLHGPPFSTVAEWITGGTDFFTWECAAPDGIDFDRAILIGDFGLGSDAPIVLDYRAGAPPPRVLRLRWARGVPNEWIEVASSFPRFVELLGI